MASILSLANEIIDEVVSYLPLNSDRLSVMYSCSCLHWPAARLLYRHVSVSDYQARRLFKMVTESGLGYEYFIKTLKYKASSNADVHLTHLLLRDAIPRLSSLRHLTLAVRSTLSPFLIYILKRSVSLPKDLASDFDDGFYSPRTISSKTFHGSVSLQTFSIRGDIRLLQLVTYQNIEKMEISEPMTDTEFLYFLDTVAPRSRGKNSRMIDLTVTLQKTFGRRIVSAILSLGDRFPNIRRLGVRGMRINALDVSQLMTLKPPLFPYLDRLEVNTISFAVQDQYPVSDVHPFQVQENHVRDAGFLRPAFRIMKFGDLSWYRIAGTDTWFMVSEENITPEDVDMLPENFSSRPYEWVLEYTEPVDVSEVRSIRSKLQAEHTT